MSIDKNTWISATDSPPIGTEVLGFHPSWIDEDYNPEGTCACFICDEGYWTIAKWCGTCDEWHTAYSEKWTAHQEGEGHKLKNPRKGQGVKESDMSTRIMVAPTHWMQKPTPQKKLNQ